MKVVGVESPSILVLYHGSSHKPEFEESLTVHFVDFDTRVCEVSLKESAPSTGSACSFAPPTSGTSFEDNYLNSQVQAGVQCMKFLVSSLRHFVGDTVSANATSVVGDLHALLKKKHFDAIFIALPVETISRAEFSNSIGPEPRRTIVHPFGFPWQKGCDNRVHRITAVAATMLTAAIQARLLGIQIAMWAPEDTGTAPRGDPASWWQFWELQFLSSLHAQRYAFYLCRSLENALFPRPTGLLTSMSPPKIPGLISGWPQHAPKQLPREYTGPLPVSCGCGGLHSTSVRAPGAKDYPSRNLSAMPLEVTSKLVDALRVSLQGWDHQAQSADGVSIAPTVGKEDAPSLLLDPRSSGQSLGPLVQDLLCAEFNGQFDEINKVMVAKSGATLCTEFAEEDPGLYSRSKCPAPRVFNPSRRGCVSPPHSLQQKGDRCSFTKPGESRWPKRPCDRCTGRFDSQAGRVARLLREVGDRLRGACTGGFG